MVDSGAASGAGACLRRASTRPFLARRAERVEGELVQRAQLEHTRAIVGQVAGAVRRLRLGVAAAQVAGSAVRAGRDMRAALLQSSKGSLELQDELQQGPGGAAASSSAMKLPAGSGQQQQQQQQQQQRQQRREPGK
jgi:hypothetical protein